MIKLYAKTNNLNSFVKNLKGNPFNCSKTEDFLQEHKSYIELMDSMGHGSYIFNYKENKYIYGSNHLFNILGKTEEELKGGGIEAFLSTIYKVDIDRVIFLFQESIKSLKEIPEKLREKVTVKFYFRIKKSNGPLLWVMLTKRVVKFQEAWLVIGFLDLISDSDVTFPLHSYITSGNFTKIIQAPNEHVSLTQPNLSIKEQEVLLLTKNGLTIKQIADHIFLTQAGVRYHRKNILKKSGRKNFIGI